MSLEPLFQEIKGLKREVGRVYIYGYGSYGRNLYRILKRHGIEVDGFVITGQPAADSQTEVPVYQASRLIDKKVGFVLALNEKNAREVEAYLSKEQVGRARIVNAGRHLEQFGEKRGTNVGSIEVTTMIGCAVNCRHCPQGLLVSKYFEKDRARISKMSMHTFRKCLAFFPGEYDISFGGMSEPFLNDSFIEMLKAACGEGRNVSLYTTLVGAREKDVEEILKLPLRFVVLHVADRSGYAHIPLTEEYYRCLAKLVNARKADGRPFVNMCNAQTCPDERARKICEGKYEILTEMTDRAGNLNGSGLIHNEIALGKISCGNLGREMNNNILLPDGSVVLCCMDYGLKHVLGNIYENSFAEIMQGKEMERVKAGMEGDEGIDILCRTCSYARSVQG